MEQIIETKIKKYSRPTWAEVDFSSFRFNLNQIKRFLSPEVKIMPVVKADAYGHGLVEVSNYLVSQGIEQLGIATVDEGIELREKGVGVPLFILGNVFPEELETVVEYNLIPTLCNLEVAKRLDEIAREKNIFVKAEVKVDTGMGRIGVLYTETLDFFLKLKELNHLVIDGLWTHFASAEDEEFTRIQLLRFNFVFGGLKQLGFNFYHIHSANSLALFRNKETHFNLVRPGLSIYGVYPENSLREIVELKPAMSLKTRIVFLKRVSQGYPISYGRTFITSRESIIATLPIGYGDGYSWLLSNKGRVIVKGNYAPVVGRVCMDQTMIDVTDIPGVSLGEEVVLLGRQGGLEITAEELANLSGTIPYEILCRIGSRIPRIYKDG
ncbi:MAG: alanine racemase [Candidatus Omnitrophica bacterium]|nr:alanine racemase [Candidatus Omnitrophota bacterium]MCM8793987.1 alanine racemase [Candidatus Omnitrophota bacterium]